MGTYSRKRLSGYMPPPFNADSVDILLDLHKSHTSVTSRVRYRRTESGAGETVLVLNAENPNPAHEKDYLQSIKMNGTVLAANKDYQYDPEKQELRILVAREQDHVFLEIETKLTPENNAALYGLYDSEGTIISQCAPQGFRRITPFTDRPDILSEYTVTIEADPKEFPVTLANGNQIERTTLENGRCQTTYYDPWLKPCYLFGTASGKLDSLTDEYQTKSGRPITLRIFTAAGKKHMARHALDTLKTAMQWDEDRFGCEYDLDEYNIVAASKFHYSAMENKGLNIFREDMILAAPDIATDEEYRRISEVIAHGYFHNWSGNRITIANWENLALKEGLTTLREHLFANYIDLEVTQRAREIQNLRKYQFSEDDGNSPRPLVRDEITRPENYYTATTYKKGAEVLRMMKVLMGEHIFMQGVKDFFEKYDGQAATMDDFAKSMTSISGIDFQGQFSRWFTHAGRPRVTASGLYDPQAQTYTLTLEQKTPPSAGSSDNEPFYIPVDMALVDDQDIEFHKEVLHFTQNRQSFVFKNIPQAPAYHSLFQGLSAPVDFDPGLTNARLHQQWRYNAQHINRWQAGQELFTREIIRFYNEYKRQGSFPDISPVLIGGLRQVTGNAVIDPMIMAQGMDVPHPQELETRIKDIDPLILHKAHTYFQNQMADKLVSSLQYLFVYTNSSTPYNYTRFHAGKRAIKSAAINILTAAPDKMNSWAASTLYHNANNLTDRFNALKALRHIEGPDHDLAFEDFYRRCKEEPRLLTKYFMLSATCDHVNTVNTINMISSSPEFDWHNPAHAVALFGSFAQDNYPQFHQMNGQGYDLIADAVKRLDKINPTTACKIVAPLCASHLYEEKYKKMMEERLERILKEPGISARLHETVSRALNASAAAPPHKDKPSFQNKGPAL